MADAAVDSGRFAIVLEDELALLLSNRLYIVGFNIN